MDNDLGLADPSISTAILYSWQVRMLTSSPLGEHFFNKTIFRMFSNLKLFILGVQRDPTIICNNNFFESTKRDQICKNLSPPPCLKKYNLLVLRRLHSKGKI